MCMCMYVWIEETFVCVGRKIRAYILVIYACTKRYIDTSRHTHAYIHGSEKPYM